MPVRRLLLVAVLRLLLAAVLFTGPASASWADFQDALVAYVGGDYATAYREWKPLADAGDAHAQLMLGTMYGLGQGVTKSYPRAVSWFRKAAEQDLPLAQRALGGMYFSGRGVVQSYAEAAKWHRLAAEQGVTDSQRMLARMYLEGKGVRQDADEAVKWYRRAAEKGHPVAQFTLGTMYGGGKNLPRDFVLAYMWLNLAIPGLFPGPDRDMSIRLRDKLSRLMTPDEIAEAQGLAREWLARHRKSGSE